MQEAPLEKVRPPEGRGASGILLTSVKKCPPPHYCQMSIILNITSQATDITHNQCHISTYFETKSPLDAVARNIDSWMKITYLYMVILDWQKCWHIWINISSFTIHYQQNGSCYILWTNLMHWISNEFLFQQKNTLLQLSFKVILAKPTTYKYFHDKRHLNVE